MASSFDAGLRSMMVVLLSMCSIIPSVSSDSSPSSPALMRSVRVAEHTFAEVNTGKPLGGETNKERVKMAVEAKVARVTADAKVTSNVTEAKGDVSRKAASGRKTAANGTAKGEHKHGHNESYLDYRDGNRICGCYQKEYCNFHSVGIARKKGLGKTCSNAFVIGKPNGILDVENDDLMKDKYGRKFEIKELNDCMMAVSRSKDICSYEFQMDMHSKVCSCLPRGKQCVEKDKPSGCRYLLDENMPEETIPGYDDDDPAAAADA